MKLCTIDRIVFAHIDVIGIRENVQIITVRDIGKIFILRRCRHMDFPVNRRLLAGFLCPMPRKNIIGLLAAHKVHRNHGKLEGSPALEEQHFVIVRNVHQRPQIVFGLVDDGLEQGRAVADLHDGHSAPLVAHHFIRCFLQNRPRQNRGACRKIVDMPHEKTSLFLAIRRSGQKKPAPDQK